MTGAHASFARAGVAAWALLGLCCCAPGPLAQARLVRAGAPHAGGPVPVVVVLENRPSSLNKAVLDAFSQGVEARVVAFADIAAQPPSRLAAAVRAERPDLVLALGPHAAQFTHDALPEVKAVFALVLNYRAQNLAPSAHGNLAGIAMESSLVSEFTQFKMIYPELRRFIMPYCAGQSEGMVEEARRTLGTMGLRLEPVPVDAQGALAQSLGALKRSPGDAVWLASDATVLTHARAFIEQSDQVNLPVFASVSGVLVRSGAVAAVEVDIPSIGTQAARIATQLLSGEVAPGDIGIQAPNGTLLVVNLATAQRHGLTIPLRVMPFIGETVSDLPPPGSGAARSDP